MTLLEITDFIPFNPLECQLLISSSMTITFFASSIRESLVKSGLSISYTLGLRASSKGFVSVFIDDPILRAKFSEYTYSDFLAYKSLFDDSLKVVELSNYASLKKEHYLDSIHLVLKDTTDQLIEKLL